MTKSTPALIDGYARRFTALVDGGHSVASPLGAWLLLALVAPAADGRARDGLEQLLGTDAAAAAARRAGDLLSTPHPAVASALAAWTKPQAMTRKHAAWAAGLPSTTESGAVPSPADADSWARRVTNGTIDRFPIDIEPTTALVLANALATKVAWVDPFTVTGSAKLGGPWSDHVKTVLADSGSVRSRIVPTRAAGDVAAHVAYSADGLAVVSVLAGADVAPAAVHAGAAEVSAILAADRLHQDHLSLFDLPLGDGAAWTLTEERLISSGSARQENIDVVLPAWEASGDHDLLAAPGLGFRDASATLIDMLNPEFGPYDAKARQVARASYTKDGFEAAAITAMGISFRGVPQKREVTIRTAGVRFNRPYAVVAVAMDRSYGRYGQSKPLDVPAWHGVPVFNAWVCEAADPAELPPTQ